jgi:ABC-type sugar transport system ATPase subunit
MAEVAVNTGSEPFLSGAADAAIEARTLVKTYGGKVRALDGLSLSVPRGSIFALLGPNGAGKSTAIKILTTLSRPDSGDASVAASTCSENRSASVAASDAWRSARASISTRPAARI